MHLRGKAFRYELIPADGSEPEIVLDVPDNSEANPANPEPEPTEGAGAG